MTNVVLGRALLGSLTAGTLLVGLAMAGPPAGDLRGPPRRPTDTNGAAPSPVGVRKMAVEQVEAGGLETRPRVILSDQEKARGSTAGTGTAEAYVYKNDDYTGNYTILVEKFNFAAQTTSTVVNEAGVPIPNPIGAFIADDMTLGGGWSPGTPISSFAAWVNRSASDQTRLIGDGSTRVTLTLWDGDPLNLVDSTGAGYASAPIPGASCDFTVPASVEFAEFPASILKCNLPVPIVPPHDSVWMVLTSDSCRLFWPLVLTVPTVGSNAFDVAEISWDDDAGVVTDGTCCNPGGAACGPGAGILNQYCAGDLNNVGGRCSDGDSEHSFAFDFGGPCNGYGDYDSCANYWARIFSPARGTLSLTPVGGDGSLAILGNEIFYAGGGGQVILEVRIGDWDPDDRFLGLEGFSAWLDPAGFTSGVEGALTFANIPCDTTEDCTSVLGGTCSFTGDPCASDADCSIAQEPCTGPVCWYYDGPGSGSGVPVGNTKVCWPGYIDGNRTDYVFHGVPGGDQPFVDLSTPEFRWASSTTYGEPRIAPSPFPAGGLYAGTLLLDVSDDASGTFTVSLRDPPYSLLVVLVNTFLPLTGVVPAKITVLDCTGPDCQSNGKPDDCEISLGLAADCNDNGVPDECDLAGGASSDCDDNSVPDDCQGFGDADGDGVIDPCDPCPHDADYVDAVDSDGDGVLDCNDQCPGFPDDAPGGCAVPTVSGWGIACLALLLLVIARVTVAGRRAGA